MAIAMWRLAALLLTALSMGLAFCHVMELPAKMMHPPQFYAAVNSTLYGAFGVIGAAVVVGGVAATAVLAWLVRQRRPAFRWTLAAAICFALSLAMWRILVYPVNAEAVRAWESVYAAEIETLELEVFRSPPEPVVQVWAQQRQRWEYGHATTFVIQLLGFGALAWSILVETRLGRGAEVEG
ncbi:MAG TPA: hypothetical protein VF184_10450 [Phycisphaeraceae bacterium]